MAPRELHGLAKREREAKPMDEPERERDEPSPLEPSADDVLERHVHNRQRDQDLDQRREPKSVGREAKRRGDEGDGMRDGERRDDRDERPHLPEWNDEAENEQQMVDAVEDVSK